MAMAMENASRGLTDDDADAVRATRGKKAESWK
jgi:hypothetical protein